MVTCQIISEVDSAEVDFFQIEFCPILITLLPPCLILRISLKKSQRTSLAPNILFYHLAAPVDLLQWLHSNSDLEREGGGK